MAIHWCQGKITDKIVWADGLFTIRVRVPDILPFQPGQFLQVGVPREPKHLHRPYSVASPHGDEIEFYIVLVEDGELTPILWKMEPGDEVDVAQRAAGSFTLAKTPPAKNLWLIATGTGLAPYIAMLRTTEPWDKYEKIVVVHGVRHYLDLGYTEEMRELERQRPGAFRLIQMLTREEHDSTLHGRIPSGLDSGELEKTAECPITPEDSAIMLCGNPAMLDDMEAMLGERGLKKHRSRDPGQIVLERYW